MTIDHSRGARIAALALVAAAGILPGGLVEAAEPAPPEAPAASAPAEALPVPSLPKGLAQGWYAWIETTMGVVVARLLPEQAPRSVAYFAALAEARIPWPDPVTGEDRTTPYYDGIPVRIAVAARRFEIGDRGETGRGSPPFFVPPDEGKGPVNFSRPFRLGMTFGATGRISGSRFFVTAGSLPSYNTYAPCFGEVVAGQDVVSSIASVRTRPSGAPLERVTIRRIRILKAGSPSPLPDPVPYTPEMVPFDRR